MAVKTGKKKMSRRVKRTIRKTLSGVCLASALIVALIPATPTRGYVAPTYTTADVSYAYGISDNDQTDLSTLDANLVGIDLAAHLKTPTPTIYKTLTVKKLSTGAYELGWQFEVYKIPSGAAAGKGIISKYNSTYATGTLNIAATLPLSYNVVENDFYEAFFAKMYAAKEANSSTATVQYDPSDASSTRTMKAKFHLNKIEATYNPESDQDMASLYFPEQYAVYKGNYETWKANKDNYDTYVAAKAVWDQKKAEYDAYVLAYNEWVAGGKVGVEPVAKPDPGPEPTVVNDPGPAPEMDFWVSDMEVTHKYEYFCGSHPFYQNALGGLNSAREFTLEKVIDSRNGTQTPLQYCYMPKGVPNKAVNSIDVNDEFGFLGSDWTIILGIGSEAFANTTNVTALQLADELKYIGDNAFYNSFVESISFDNVQDIGNRAFKDCTRLKTVNLSNTTVNIGTEAFYGCNTLQSLTLPQSIGYIGPGAFAECSALTTLDLSAINQSNCCIDNFAFYNCIALSNVSFSDHINRLGDCAFACGRGVTGSLTNFKFPDHITGSHTCSLHNSAVPAIGNFVLAGRSNLKTVTMPSDYGRSTPVELPLGTFYNCINLQSVTFPDDGGGSCGYVSFGSVGEGDAKRTIFDTIQTKEFCVYGPAKDNAGKTATPRKSTWGLKSGLKNDIPYIYRDATGEHVELSNGDYIFIIDDKGVLQSCVFADPQNKPAVIENMVIPTYVGDTKVTGIAGGCFASEEGQDVLNRIKKLVLSDDTVSEIADSAFKTCALLEEVVIGNSVKTIGASAFENCPELKKVTVGSGVTSIGNAAFKDCKKLTYVKFDTPAGGYASFPMENLGAEAFSTGASKLIFEGDVDESYGPFKWATKVDNFVDESTGLRVCYTTGFPSYQTIIVDNRNGYPTLVDYLHFDQIDAYAEAEGIVKETDPARKSVILRYEKMGQEETDASGNMYTYSVNRLEEEMIKAAINLVVPSGVKSIDVNGYMNNTTPTAEGFSDLASNSYNVNTYLLERPYYPSYKANDHGGLFSNYYGTVNGNDGKREFPDGDAREKADIGNDRLQSVTLNSVKYLPDYAFYDCEGLSNLNLGSELTEMGDAPFTGCTNLTGIGSTTENFACENGIVYSKNSDGTYNIVEVLSTRGTLVGSMSVSPSEADPLLYNVKEILPGAFENCDGITSVDFTGMDSLTEIPDNCFKDCDYLQQVTLPDNITAVGHDAFAGCMEGVRLVVYGKEVYLPGDAFGAPGSPDYVNRKTVISYKDSAVRKAAGDLGADVSTTLDDAIKVQFYDYDGTPIGPTIFVNKGSSVSMDDIPEDPTRAGYTFAGWRPALKGLKIEQDTIIIATYEPIKETNPTDPSGNNPSGNNPGGNNGSGNGNGSQSGNNTQFYTLTVTNGNGSGSYAAGATVIITCTNPPSGQVFDKWVPTTDDLGIASVNVAATTLKMPAHEASVTATFKNAPSGSSGSGNGGSSSQSGNNNSGNKNNGTTVFISKPGVSNTSLASAQVSGSSDNYVIRISETAAATAAVEKALTNEYGSLDDVRYSAMDISLYDATGTNRITNYSGLSITITMPIPDVMTQYAGNNKVAGVVNEKLDKLKPKFTSIDGVPCVTFTATHFSPYTIYVNTKNLSGEPITIDGSPKTGDGIHPKWFLVAGLLAISIALFFMKDKKPVPKGTLA